MKGKYRLQLILAVIVILQLVPLLGHHPLVGFPFNFLEYNPKFESWQFFVSRLGMSMLFSLGVAAALSLILKSRN